MYKANKHGDWRRLNGGKTGVEVPYTFGEGALGSVFRLDVYKATKKLLSDDYNAVPYGSLEIVPAKSETPKITKVELLHTDDTPGKKFSFTEKLQAKAYTVGLFNKELTFTF